MCLYICQGWCGWKGPEFWDQNAYYNLCLPQRPKTIWVTCMTLIHFYSHSNFTDKHRKSHYFKKCKSTHYRKVIYYSLSLQCFKCHAYFDIHFSHAKGYINFSNVSLDFQSGCKWMILMTSYPPDFYRFIIHQIHMIFLNHLHKIRLPANQ